MLEPLLVRYVPREDTYYIISGERRYHASQAAGLHELPCIEKIADDAETLELALIENLQRKDLTPFEEADGLQRLADHFDYTHDDIAKKIGRARSSVTESMSLRVIPAEVRERVRREAESFRSRCCCKWRASPARRRCRKWSRASPRAGSRATKPAAPARRKPSPLRGRSRSFSTTKSADEAFHLRIQFRKSHVTEDELAAALREVLRQIESGRQSSAAVA